MDLRPPNDDRGAAAVELALVLPILVLLLFGIVEFGRGYNAKVTLTHAAREGVRALAIGKDEAAVKDTVQDAVTPLTLDPATHISVSTCTPGQPATVTVSYPFTYTIPMFGQGTMTLSSKGTMRCGG
jgi:Flp pilus assembly protein TadG